jgi:hypothetical protein
MASPKRLLPTSLASVGQKRGREEAENGASSKNEEEEEDIETRNTVLAVDIDVTEVVSKRQSRLCTDLGCKKQSQGANGKCIAHGGDRRCDEQGCIRMGVGSNGK